MADQLKVAAFYCFAECPDADELAKAALETGRALDNLLGTLIVAPEGINATLAGPKDTLDSFLAFLLNDPRFAKMDIKVSWSSVPPFGYFRVKRKNEIVTFRQPNANPNEEVGQYVEPGDWNQLIQREDIILIDTRNAYEVEVGKFKGALDPGTDNFTAFAQFFEENQEKLKDKAVAMYCTGGIRCERATAWLLKQNCKEVFHLKGGILNYLEKVPPEESLWEGECLVFDNRVALDHKLQPSRQWKFDPETGRPIQTFDKL